MQFNKDLVYKASGVYHSTAFQVFFPNISGLVRKVGLVFALLSDERMWIVFN